MNLVWHSNDFHTRLSSLWYMTCMYVCYYACTYNAEQVDMTYPLNEGRHLCIVLCAGCGEGILPWLQVRSR